MDQYDPKTEGDGGGGTHLEGTAKRERQRQPHADRDRAHQARVLQQRRRRPFPPRDRRQREEARQNAHERNESLVEIGGAHRYLLSTGNGFVGERVQGPVQDKGQCDDENRIVDEE